VGPTGKHLLDFSLKNRFSRILRRKCDDLLASGGRKKRILERITKKAGKSLTFYGRDDSL
jgi:hypothetical protein